MQIVALGDNLHEISKKSYFLGKNKENIIKLFSTESGQTVVVINIDGLPDFGVAFEK